MAYNKDILGRQHPVVQSFVEHLAYHRGLHAAWDRDANPSLFWSLTVAGHLHLASIAWCKVFGTYSEDIHWTKTPTGNAAEETRESFRQRIYDTTGFAPEKWKAYHTRMIEMRGKYVTHLDVDEPITGTIPSFDPALQVAYVYEEWVNEIIGQHPQRQLTLKSVSEGRMKEASLVISRHSRRESPTP